MGKLDEARLFKQNIELRNKLTKEIEENGKLREKVKQLDLGYSQFYGLSKRLEELYKPCRNFIEGLASCHLKQRYYEESKESIYEHAFNLLSELDNSK